MNYDACVWRVLKSALFKLEAWGTSCWAIQVWNQDYMLSYDAKCIGSNGELITLEPNLYSELGH